MAQLQSTVVTGSLYISGSDPKVGIGTTNPGFKLQVATPTESTDPISFAFDITRENSTSRGLTFGMATDDSYGAIGTHNANLQLGHTFGTETNGQPAFYPTLTISHVDQSVGKVGIGTTSPGNVLHISGSNNSTPVRFEIGEDANYYFKANSTSGYATTFNMDNTGLDIGHNSSGRALNLQTNSQDRLTILGGGNVGIGTTSPDTKLEIVGADPILTIRDSSTSLASAKAFLRLAESGASDTLNRYVQVALSGSALGTNLTFDLDGNEKMRINESGNVGIGETAPGSKLHVKGAASFLTIENSTAGSSATPSYSGILFVQSNGTSTGASIQSGDQLNSNSNNDLIFTTRATGGGTHSERVRITGDGDVRLSGGDLYLNSGTNYNDKGVLYLSNERTAIISDIVNLTAQGDTSLDFQTRKSGTRASAMFIDEFRNVGIGTTTPAQKLTVDGTISGSSDLSIDGDSVFDGTVGYNEFNSGFGGTGWRIDADANAEFQNLTVRGTFSVYELLAQQVRATNGSLLVATSGKVDDVTGSTITFDTGSGYGHGFLINDILLSQRLDPVGGELKRSFIQVTSTSTTASLNFSVLDSSDSPEPGFEYVRIGNTANVNRQGHIYLTADDTYAPYIGVRDGLSGSAQFVAGDSIEKVRVGKLDGITSSTFGSLSGYGFWATGNAYLEGGISATFGSIGGFGITATAISSSNNSLILRSNGDITGSQVLFTGGDIGGFSISQDALSGDNFYLSGSATGNEFFISSSDFNVKANGDVTASSFLFEGGKITGDVTFLAPLEGSTVIYYDDFSIYPNASSITSTGNSPKIDGSGEGYSIFNAGGLGEIALVSGEGELFGESLKLGNNSGNDEVWLTGNRLVPFNSHSLYELEVRAKNPNGSGQTYVGITAYASNGTTKVNASGVDSFSSQHYFALAGDSISSDYTVYKGYFKGVASSGNGGKHSTKTDPGTIHVNAANGFITPLILANYNDQTGDTYIDYVKITEFNVGGGSTVISGDTIKTGTIKSNNLSADLGTQLALDDGEMRIGGTGAYTSNNGILLDGPNAQFAVGNAGGSYIRFNHTANKIEINTDNFDIDSSGNVTMTGTVTANAGEIGGFSISSDAISGNNFYLSGSATGNEFFISASNFNVKANGDVTASNANIEGRIVAETGELRDLDVTGTLTMTDTSNGTITNTDGNYIISSSGIILASPSGSSAPVTSRLTFKSSVGAFPIYTEFNSVGELFFNGFENELTLRATSNTSDPSLRLEGDNRIDFYVNSGREAYLDSSKLYLFEALRIGSYLDGDGYRFSNVAGSGQTSDELSLAADQGENQDEGGGVVGGQDGTNFTISGGKGGDITFGNNDAADGGNLILKAGAGGVNTVGSGNPGASGSIQMFGNVGIGTSSPTHLLSLSRASQAAAYQLDINNAGGISDGNYTGIRFSQASGGTTELGNIKVHYYSTGRTALSMGTRHATQAIYIDNTDDGNVGIGTASPTEKLEVTGNLILDATDANIKIKPGGVGTKGDIQWTFNTDSTVYASAGIEYDNRGTDGFLIDSGYPITMDFAGSYIRWQYNGNEKMRLNSSGNVGIGTTSPSANLHVVREITTTGIEYPLIVSGQDTGNDIDQGTSSGIGLKFEIAGNDTAGDSLVGASIVAMRESATDANSSTGLAFLISQNDTTLDEAVRIDENGNVGIGTTSPGALLELKESSNAAGDAVIRLRGHGNNADNTVLGAVEWFNTDSSGNQPGVVARVEAQSGNANGHMGELVFKTHDGTEGGEGSDPVERMRIDATGNVGIGTSSPSYELAVRKDSAIPELAIEHFDTPSDNDTIGSILFRGNKLDDYDTASITTAATYAQIRTVITDISDNSADSKLEFRTQNNNTLTTGMSIEGTNVNIVNDLTVGGSIDGTISPSGNLSITGGNVVLDSGQGIDFSATANGTTGASGSVSSELLDDYEEGTWTPLWESGGFSRVDLDIVSAYYTKVGNLVTISAYLRTTRVDHNPVGSTDVFLKGLPFTPLSNEYFSVNVGYSANFNEDAADDHPSGGYIENAGSGARVRFHYRSAADGASFHIKHDDFFDHTTGTKNNIMFSAIYYT